MPDPEIHVYRKGWWRPWRWTFVELLDGAEGGLQSLPIEGRAWSQAEAWAHARLCQLLRRSVADGEGVRSSWVLRDLLKRHAESRDFVGCHLRMSGDTLAAYRRAATEPPKRLPWEPDLGMLLGLDVVIDERVPEGRFVLAENRKPHKVRERGSVGDDGELLAS